MNCYLETHIKADCTGCSACAQVCPKSAIQMIADDEGFLYPSIDETKCVNCGLCIEVCSDHDVKVLKNSFPQKAFGGHIRDGNVLANSTSGGAFSAVAYAYCQGRYAIFGAECNEVYGAKHSYVTDINDMDRFRGSKYSQSSMGNAYDEALKFLKKDYKVLFSGTPCQIGGLKKYLKNRQYDNLLTVEVVCEGVPSPLFMKKQVDAVENEHFGETTISGMKYRDKNGDRWDYQVMSYTNGEKIYKVDRWFNPFWSIWLQHLISRPSCYTCEYTTKERVADITLGDLWGVHLYCPDLYNDNRGASLIVCNTPKGCQVFEKAKELMYSRELDFEEALKYQGPMRRCIEANPNRDAFMSDLRNLPYKKLCKKWAKPSSIKLLISKYIYGTNRQKCRKYRK